MNYSYDFTQITKTDAIAAAQILAEKRINFSLSEWNLYFEGRCWTLKNESSNTYFCFYRDGVIECWADEDRLMWINSCHWAQAYEVLRSYRVASQAVNEIGEMLADIKPIFRRFESFLHGKTINLLEDPVLPPNERAWRYEWMIKEGFLMPDIHQYHWNTFKSEMDNYINTLEEE